MQTRNASSSATPSMHGAAACIVAFLLIACVVCVPGAESLSATTTKASSSSSSSSASPKMYIFGDVHYDPFYATANAVGSCTSPDASPKFGTKSCDSSLALMESAFADIGKEYKKDGNGVILLTGDFVRHNMHVFTNKTAGKKHEHDKEYDLIGKIVNTVDYFIQKLVATTGMTVEHAKSNVIIPHPSIAPVIGNEDCVPDYHFNDSANGYHPALAKFSEAMINNSILSAEEGKTFGKCGFYSRLVKGTNLFLLNLNTVLYSIQHKPGSQRPIPDPCDQFVWLKAQLDLARSKGHSVHIVGHIIPFSSKWEQHYVDTFRGIVMNFTDVIRVQWFAHTHMFNFYTLSEHKAPMAFDVPAISPIDGQRPSYLRVSTSTYNSNETWSVDEIHLRYLSSTDNTWTDGYQFANQFKIPKPLTTNKLYEFGKKMLGEHDTGSAWTDFETMHFGGEVDGNHIGKKGKSKLICKMITASRGDYEDCRGK